MWGGGGEGGSVGGGGGGGGTVLSVYQRWIIPTRQVARATSIVLWVPIVEFASYHPSPILRWLPYFLENLLTPALSYGPDEPRFEARQGRRDCYLLQNVQSGSEAHPASHSTDTVVLSWG